MFRASGELRSVMANRSAKNLSNFMLSLIACLFCLSPIVDPCNCGVFVTDWKYFLNTASLLLDCSVQTTTASGLFWRMNSRASCSVEASTTCPVVKSDDMVSYNIVNTMLLLLLFNLLSLPPLSPPTLPLPLPLLLVLPPPSPLLLPTLPFPPLL